MTDRFSKRQGYSPEAPAITVRHDAPEELRGVIVDIAYEAGYSPYSARATVCRVLRRRENSDNWSAYPNVDNEVRGLIDDCEWYEVYDVIEALYGGSEDNDRFETEINAYFQRRGIGWQLINGRIEARGEEAFEQAVVEARNTLASTGKETSARELHEALLDLSRRPSPDVTGAVQHALAALECAIREYTGNPKATLGVLLKNNPGLIPSPLDTAVEKLWGFASEQGRHLREGREPEYEDALLCVHVVAAVSNYLAKRIGG